MDALELAYAGIARQAELVTAGDVSSRELVELHLERISRLDPELNAFRVVWPERALAGADEADRRRATGDDAPLLGVPVAIKDELAQVEGDVTTVGTGAVDEPARADSEMVRRLRSAGAVLLGKTNLPELAICGFTESKTWGITRNPWDLARTPGGSSGGSGAAVATGMVGAATGSDGAGSIRIPAANCGLFGLKPQRGRIPLAPLAEHWYGLSVNGCLTRTVRDTALFLDVTAGPAAGEAPPPPPERPFLEAADRPPDRLRVAISMRPPRLLAPPIVDDSVRGAVEGTADLLRSLGHRTDERDPAFGLVGNAFTTVYLRGIHDDVRAVPHPERLEGRTRGFGRLGALTSRRALRRALDAIPKHAARIGRTFEDHDVLLTATAGAPPVEVGRWEGRGALRTLVGMGRLYPFTGVWNYTGQPAAAIPAGFTADGLPLSVQLVGRPGDEATLLSLAAQIEAERPWADRRPPLDLTPARPV